MSTNTRKSIQRLVQKVRNQSVKELAIKAESYISAVSKIVLGVYISIWLNNLNEAWGQRDIARSFLKGVKADLTNDLFEMRDDSASIDRQHACAEFMSFVSGSTQISNDSVGRFLIKNNSIYTTNTILAPNNGRYEGITSSNANVAYLRNPKLRGYYTYLRDKLSVIHENYARCLRDTELVLKLVKEELAE